MTIGHPTVGTDVAGYRIEHLLGRGGMGTVYRAFDVRLGRPVALKLLTPGASGSDGAPERLLHESRLAARLDHPNVIPIYEAGQQDGRLFIAMRYVAGGDLKELLRREGALPPARAVALAAQVADALDAAHRRGLVHRDVKPSNVLLDSEDGREHCYLADFGLTQSTTDRGPADGQGMGTIDYVAPEQIRGDPLDGRADQYALACLLFECLTGSVPYRARSDVAAIFAHLEEPVPRASERAADLPAAIDPVLARGMAKLPEERFESCSELVAEASTALGVAAAARPARRRLAALVVAAVVVAVVATVLVLGRDAPAPPAATGSLTRVDARTNKVVERTEVAGHPGNLAVTPRRDLDGRLHRRRALALRARRRPAPARHLQRRAARPGRPRRQGLRRRRRSLPVRRGRALRRFDRRATGGDRAAGVRGRLGRGRALGRRLPGRAAAQHPRRPAARARERLPPVPLTRDRREPARAVPRTCDRRRLAVGARRRAGPPDVAARRANGRVPEDDRARLPAHIGGGRGRVGVDHRRAQRPCRAGGRRDWSAASRGLGRTRRERASPPGPARCGWRTRSTGLSRGSIRRRAGSSRRSGSAAFRAAWRSATRRSG